MKVDFTKLDRAFNPKCIVVVGDKDKFQWLRSESTFQGKLYSVQISPGTIKAIEAVHQGELWIERKVMARFFDEEAIPDSREEDRHVRAKDGLTPREEEVLRLLTTGSTNKEIAEALFISEKTVKSHLNSIFRKLKVTRRLQAILYVIKRELS